MSFKLKSILLIDDNEDDNFIHEIVLSELKISSEIRIFESATSALSEISNGYQPELIFLDINMPLMNGWEFLETCEKSGLSLSAKIIVMLTTPLSRIDREKADSFRQITGYAVKPLTTECVYKILKENF